MNLAPQIITGQADMLPPERCYMSERFVEHFGKLSRKCRTTRSRYTVFHSVTATVTRVNPDVRWRRF
jgi:hypothetical protein